MRKLARALGSGIARASVAAIVLAFQLSPWPSVAIIQHAFSHGDQASEAALEKHVPSNTITRRNLTYGGGPDDKFDISYPAGTSRPRATIF